MIYLIGGAPRTGKSTLCQRVANECRIGWISTDLIKEVLDQAGVKKPARWSANLREIADAADRFFPYLERFIWGVNSMADAYVIEGVDFLPSQVSELSKAFALRAVFLGRSTITLDQLDRFPGKSPGYAGLPRSMRTQIAKDVPGWSDWIEGEAQ